jgi:hypothetical protein
MSLGPSNTVKTSENNLGGISQQATNQAFPLDIGTGQQLLSQGGQNINSGTNFLNTILNGNQANTTALLQPNISSAAQGNQNSVQALTNLDPRGGGRSGSLFGASYAPTGAITNLFNGARGTAATTLPQIGLAQEGLGTNLFNTGNNALSTATGASTQLGNLGFQQQQYNTNLLAGLGQFATQGAGLGLMAAGLI